MSFPTKRAAAYMRTAAAGGFGRNTLDRQAERIREYAERHGYAVVYAYSDLASGLQEDRPGLNALLEDAADEVFDAVIICDVSRLFRSFPLFMQYHALLHGEYGVDVVFVVDDGMEGGDA